MLLLLLYLLITMTPPKKKGLQGHLAARANLCIVCLKKKDRALTTHFIEALKKFTTIFESITPEDHRVPTGMCNSCRTTLQTKLSGAGENRILPIPEGFSFISHVILPKTRLADANFCSCLLCEIASKKGNPKMGDPKKGELDLKELIKSREEFLQTAE